MRSGLPIFIQQAFRPLAEEIDRFWQRPAAERRPEQYLAYLKSGLLAFSELMTQPHTLNLSKIMSREQLSPTDAYPLIHQQVIAPLHSKLCRLLAAYTGIDERSTKIVLHTHALLGEVLSFRIARKPCAGRLAGSRLVRPKRRKSARCWRNT